MSSGQIGLTGTETRQTHPMPGAVRVGVSVAVAALILGALVVAYSEAPALIVELATGAAALFCL
ncbi:MAG: hypothetical protein ACFCUN_05565 [Hyphomicrobiaceae bacterium]